MGRGRRRLQVALPAVSQRLPKVTSQDSIRLKNQPFFLRDYRVAIEVRRPLLPDLYLCPSFHGTVGLARSGNHRSLGTDFLAPRRTPGIRRQGYSRGSNGCLHTDQRRLPNQKPPPPSKSTTITIMSNVCVSMVRTHPIHLNA